MRRLALSEHVDQANHASLGILGNESTSGARTGVLAAELERKSGTLVHVGRTRSIIGVLAVLGHVRDSLESVLEGVLSARR